MSTTRARGTEKGERVARHMDAVVAVAFGYLAGSVPFGLLLSRRRGIDLRHVGSGNIGAANVLRTSGTTYAMATMCLDAMKGAVPVLVAERLTEGSIVPVMAGLAAVVAHVYPVWLGFRGGKGVATTAGAFAVLSPGAVLIASGVFVTMVWVTRYISVGSIAAAVTLAVAAAVGPWPASVAMGAACAALIVLHRHRGNLARLMAGTERRIGQRA